MASSNVMCPDCKVEIEVTICRSVSGYYVGHRCKCGAFQKSEYYTEFDEVERVFNSGQYNPKQIK
jgi:hypothetical protein